MVAFWWVLNVVFLFVVIPVVVLLLNRVMTPAVEIHRYASDVVEHIQILVQHLHGAKELARTRDVSRSVGQGVRRYAAAVDQVL